jgi:phosphatidylglycerophosphatase C
MRRVPAPPPAPRPVVAAFDVDGTLTRRDSLGPFLVRLAGARLAVAIGRRPGLLASGLLRRDHDRLKALACTALAGIDEGRARARGASYARELYDRRLREDTPARLREHRASGHRVVLVSASLEHYLEPLGELLGVDAVLCTRLVVDAEGRLTGALRGANCRGPEKEQRLRAWLAGQDMEDPLLWAYGDSAGDDALLAMADRPIRVGRSRLAPGLVA